MNETKKIFWNCGACSHTFFNILNREFGCPKEDEERASDPLAGGLMQTGHQCGMLWGSSLAVGAEAFRRFTNKDFALVTAISATQTIMTSFSKRTNTHNCRDFTRCDMKSFSGMTKFMIKTIITGFFNSPCFNLAEKWAPEAIISAYEGLKNAPKNIPENAMSCASEVVKKMGASEEEALMVSGFAGGLGMSGNACGALAAAIWMKVLVWTRMHPGKTPPYWNNKQTKRIIKNFYLHTNSNILCNKICNKKFSSVSEHTQFLKEGGCSTLIDMLSKS